MTNHRRRLQVRRRRFDGYPPEFHNRNRANRKAIRVLNRRMRLLSLAAYRAARVMDQFGRMVVPASVDASEGS